MKRSMLYRLFRECLGRNYKHTEEDTGWDFARRGSTLILYFEKSNGQRDWLSNLNFHAVAYRDMEPPWQCHAGFLKVWKSVRPHVAALLADPTIRRVVVVGYSHGAALAVLCHEFIDWSRPDLRETLVGIGFGCPRVLYGDLPPEVAARWEHFYVIRNSGDLVTHLPPRVLGYTHVGNLIEVGSEARYNAIDAHRPESYLKEL